MKTVIKNILPLMLILAKTWLLMKNEEYKLIGNNQYSAEYIKIL